MDGGRKRICGARHQRRPSYRATVAIRLTRRRRRPLRAKSKDGGPFSVGQKKGRYRRAGYLSLVVDLAACVSRLARRFDVGAAGTSFAFGQPTRWGRRLRQRYFRRRNTEVRAHRRKEFRTFGFYDLGAVAKELPTRGETAALSPIELVRTRRENRNVWV